MMVMARSMGYPRLLEGLRGRRVALWHCGTCARICGIAGEEAIGRLVEKLESDGVEVVSVQGVSASCLKDRVIAKADMQGLSKADVIIALCCDVGAEVLQETVVNTNILNPVLTFGQGVREADGSLHVTRPTATGLPPRRLSYREACCIAGLDEGPF